MKSGFSFILLFLTLSCSTINHLSKEKRKLAESKCERVIIDTDSAIFWDDGAALAMLLQNPDLICIEGISLVLGNHWPYQGAEYIARILKIAQRSDIKIYIGADQPLKNSKKQLLQLEKQLVQEKLIDKSGFWKGAYGRPKEIRSFEQVEPVKGETLTKIKPEATPAVDFIIETLNHSIEPITFVAIGPLTNLAMAIQKDSRITAKIQRLLIMGGNIDTKGNTTPFAELNFLFDPEATKLVLQSNISEKLLFPLDLSEQGLINRERFNEIVNIESPYTKLLQSDRGPKFVDENYTVQSWDTLVAAYLIYPDYITEAETLSLKVEDQMGLKYGQVTRDQNTHSHVKVMKKMNSEGFFEVLKNSLTAPIKKF